MNSPPKRIEILGFILFAFVFCPVSGGALMTFQPNDGNVRYLDDVHRSTENISGTMALTTGDFDGDGLDDVAICIRPYAGHRAIDLFIAPFEADSFFSVKNTMEIRYAISADVRTFLVPPSLALADLDNDGKADLIVGRYDYGSGQAEVDIVWGKKNPTGVIDLDAQATDCRILGVSQVAAGDFDGDGITDLAMGRAGSAVGYVGLGGHGLFSGVINIAVTHPFHPISLHGNLRYIMSGDFNGDHRTDFAFSPPGDGFDGFWREVDIVLGRESLPNSPPDLAVDVRIMGNPDGFFIGMTVGDVTGDGRAELFIQQGGGSYTGTLWAIDGEDISGGKPILLQATGQPNSVTFYSVGTGIISSSAKRVAGDFDGDGADDFFPILQNGLTSGFLTSAIHPGGISLSEVSLPSMEWVGNYFERVGIGDLNGDGFKDLAVYEVFNSIYPPYGAFRVLYGFRPLKNPAVRVLSEENLSPRVSLALSVEGDPTEMFLSGDITNDFKEKWIPFKSIQEVVLSPTEGMKTVTVIFRNAVGRTSDLTQTKTNIQAGNTSVVTGSNRLRPGGTVAFDCHVITSGFLRARIFSSAGIEVLDLENRVVEPGVYPLFWDGRNGSGNRVSRGVYYLVIDADGGRSKKEILVE